MLTPMLKRIPYWSILFWIGCAPPGKPSRTLSQPFDLGKVDDSVQLSNSQSVDLQAGLPPACKIATHDQGAPCLRCLPPLSVFRCLSPRATLEKHHCWWNESKIKCLNGELALHVDLERSQEQVFKKQLTLLIGAIQGIALHKVEAPESQKQLQVLLSFLLDHMEAIAHLQGELHATELAEKLARGFELNHQGSLQEAFQAIYRKRVEGELTPDLSRDFLVKVLGLFPDLHQVKHVLLDLNLEGIDD